MIKHGEPPYLECSSKGDKRFSAFYAQVEHNGIVRSIEAHYQAAKIFEDGSTGLDWRQAKGRKAVNQEEVARLYSVLWNRYISKNPELAKVLIAAKGLSDTFGQPGHVCQATELWRIRNLILEAIAKQSTAVPKPVVYWTGIGSRSTPPEKQTVLTHLGKTFAEYGFVLRSGGALGADWACELGVNQHYAQTGKLLKDIFLPWDNFKPDPNQQPNWKRSSSEPKVQVVHGTREMMEIAERYHPNWHKLSDGAKRLHTRNVPQVLGLDLDTPSRFVVCWAEEDRWGVKGGTGQAVRIAQALHIPVFNLWRPYAYENLLDFVDKLLKE